MSAHTHAQRAKPHLLQVNSAFLSMAYKTWSYSIYAFIPTAWNEDIQVLLGFMLQISKEDDAGQDRWPLKEAHRVCAHEPFVGVSPSWVSVCSRCYASKRSFYALCHAFNSAFKPPPWVDCRGNYWPVAQWKVQQEEHSGCVVECRLVRYSGQFAGRLM